jgi:hypothetical protein
VATFFAFKRHANTIMLVKRSKLSFVLLLIAIGCGKASVSDVAPVHGRVTLDGQPMPLTSVVFQVPGRSLSGGFTDDKGNYELIYKRGVNGAVIGINQVTILEDTQRTQHPQRIPPRYNQNSELQIEVKPGDNEINFDLTTKPK